MNDTTIYFAASYILGKHGQKDYSKIFCHMHIGSLIQRMSSNTHQMFPFIYYVSNSIACFGGKNEEKKKKEFYQESLHGFNSLEYYQMRY